MKTWHRRGLVALVLCIAGIAAALLGIFYFQYISQRVYEESTNHLEEIYSQTNQSFGTFIERNWGNLDDWSRYIRAANDRNVAEFIEERKEYWNFSEFYFLSWNGNYIKQDGSEGRFENMEQELLQLTWQSQPVIVEETIEGKNVILFARPVQSGRYRGFGYDAIAVSYTSDAMVQALTTEAFSGQAMSYVADSAGKILIAAGNGGEAVNYITYLKAESNLNEAQINRLQQDWANGTSGVLRCELGGVSYYISYQSVGYQDYVLIGMVPEAAAGTSLLEIQKATVDVLVKTFILAAAIVAVLLIYRNRRRARKSRQQLQNRELMFDVLSNSVDDIYVMLDEASLSVDYISPNVEQALGIPLMAVMKNIRLLGESAVDAESSISREELSAISKRGSGQWEREHINQRTGERRWYRVTVYHKNIQGAEKFIIMMADRTQEQKVNHKLDEALDSAKSTNHAKNHFLSNMSHDIRTPMNAIIGFSILLEKDADHPDKVREYTRKISASGQHLLSLINDVLDMSKIDGGKTVLNIAQFSLPEFLEELHTILLPQANAKKQTLELHVQNCSAEQLLGDKTRLNQILINLLSNAIKYTPEGGKIEFLVQELASPSSHYAHLQFVVRDNGVGMQAKALETVFEPMNNESNSKANGASGTGMSLVITKNLVDMMGGVITATSQPGEGSIFTVGIPFAIPEQDRNGAGMPNQESVGSGYGRNMLRGLRCLIAEDNELNAEILTELLEMEGIRCELAVNGQKALEMFRQAKPGYYDLILMDVQMPEMDGYEATRQIRACGHPGAETIPIVAMTANAFAEDVQRAMDAGMNGHLSKPIDINVLKTFLSRFRGDMSQK